MNGEKFCLLQSTPARQFGPWFREDGENLLYPYDGGCDPVGTPGMSGCPSVEAGTWTLRVVDDAVSD